MDVGHVYYTMCDLAIKNNNIICDFLQTSVSGKGREHIVCSFEFVMIVGIYSLFILYDEFTSHVGTVGDTCIDTPHYVGFKKIIIKK